MDKNIIIKDKNVDSISIEKIQNILENEKSENKDLYKKIGYNSKQTFEKSLNKFLKHKTVKEWIEKGYYDFTNNANEFFVKLSKELGFKDSEINNTIFKINEYIEEKNKLTSSYIFVNTDFKRKNEPIVTIALMESIRRFLLSKNEELYFKSEDEKLNIILNFVKNHYEENHGVLTFWGKIYSYKIRLENKTFVFNVDAQKLEEDVESIENIAVLSLK